MDWISIATIASPIISAVAIIVALCISHSSSKDIKTFISVFVTTQSVNHIENNRINEEEIEEVKRKIEELREQSQIVRPFVGGARIDYIYEQENKHAIRQQIEEQEKILSELFFRQKQYKKFFELVDKYSKEA